MLHSKCAHLSAQWVLQYLAEAVVCLSLNAQDPDVQFDFLTTLLT